MGAPVLNELSRLLAEARRILPSLADCPSVAHRDLAEELRQWVEAAYDVLSGYTGSDPYSVARGLREALEDARSLLPCVDGIIREARRLEAGILELLSCTTDPVRRVILRDALEELRIALLLGLPRKLSGTIESAKRALERAAEPCGQLQP